MEANDIIPELVEIYQKPKPYDRYVLCFGVSSLGTMSETGRKIILRKGETLETTCVVAYLKKRLPKRLIFPTEDEGVRIFQSYSGRAIAGH